MEHRKVISNKNMPPRLPLISSIVVGLLLDRLHAAGWVWGACGAVFLVAWIASIYDLCVQNAVDIFEKK